MSEHQQKKSGQESQPQADVAAATAKILEALTAHNRQSAP